MNLFPEKAKIKKRYEEYKKNTSQAQQDKDFNEIMSAIKSGNFLGVKNVNNNNKKGKK